MFYIIQHRHRSNNAALLLLILYLCVQVAAQINKTVSIQKSNQTFFAYAPLAESCSYSPTQSVIAGGAYYELLDPLTIFEQIQLADNLLFWGAIRSGISMLEVQGQLLQNNTYDQVVLFNSTINSNLTSREFILTSITNQSIINFYFVTPIYLTNNTLQPLLQNSWQSDFSNSTTAVISSCQNNNQTFNIIYLGNMLYLGICPNASTFVVWNINNNTQSSVFSSIPSLNGSAVKSVTPNPSNLLPFEPIPLSSNSSGYNYRWNAAVLLEQDSTTLFCLFTLNNVQCEDYQNEELWLQIVASRAWGLQALMQQTQIQLVISEFPSIVNLTFPGNIISIFTNGRTIFIQSKENQQIYLNIFDQGNQLTNLTLPGYIVYYGNQRLLLQAPNGSFLIASFVLPVLTIQNNGLPSSITLTANCNSTDYSFLYNIVWTSIQFPSAQVLQINPAPVISYQNILTLQLTNYYQAIGPAFEVFIADSSDLSITLLDSSYVAFTDVILTLIDLAFVKGTLKNPIFILYANQFAQILKYFFKTQNTVNITKNPCGLAAITTAQKINNGYLLIDQNSQAQGCFCDSSFSDCQSLSASQLTTLLSQNSHSTSLFLTRMQEIQNDVNSQDSQTQLKRQFFGILEQGLIIKLFTNNTVNLVNSSGTVIDSIQSPCTQFNSTEAVVFTRNFYDDYLFVYCYNSPNIQQYLLRKDQIIFNRIIPLYGFMTRGPGSLAEAGNNYIFIQVNLNPQYEAANAFAFSVGKCCILRLNPTAFTVSVIAQVIQANQLIFVQTIFGADIVYYNQTEVASSQTYLKIYYDSSWISFQQSGLCGPWKSCTPSTYPYQIIFNSFLYNFAACFNASITFNISAAQLSTNSQSIQILKLQKIEGPTVHYRSQISLNFNSICGPISEYLQTVMSPLQNSMFSVQTNNIITPSKYLWFPQVVILQILDLSTLLPSTSFANFILIVTERTLTFYDKITNQDVWLQQIAVIEPPQNNCMYFAYATLNNGSVQLGTNCFNLDIDTPLLTLTYTQQQQIPLSATFSTMNLSIRLRDIESIIRPNLDSPLLFGIGEGPSKSISGMLYYCYQAWCSSLTVSSKVVFFVDYDVQTFGDSFLVVALDLTKISFWVNTSIPNATSSTVVADYMMQYRSQLGYSCNKIQIVSANSSTANLLLGCPSAYLQVQVSFDQPKILPNNVINTFNKFINCAAINNFKPVFYLQPGSDSNISLMIVECQQNLDTVRLQQFESINNSQNVIITAYMQVYSINGPLCTQNQWWPMRILPISTSMNFMLYQLYSAGGKLKILFEQIDGSIIDAFVDPSPTATYTLTQLTKQITFPEVQLNISNSYYQWLFFIQTAPEKQKTAAATRYALYIVFGLTNFITLVFLLCWLLFARKTSKTILQNTQFNRLTKKSSLSQSESYKTPEVSMHRSSESLPESSLRYSSLKNHPKRKVTEIELFQPRYNS